MKNKFTTIWLALICIFIFILQLIIPNLTDALILNQLALKGEIWRFLTAIFLHASLTHLIFNLFALIFFGLILEKFIGSNKFLVVFFSSGIIANIISVFFYPASLGASGAIMGIIGALTIIKPLMIVWTYSLPMPMFLAAIIWATGDVLGIFYPSGIGNIAHLSGLFLGLIFGLIFKTKKQLPSYSYKTRIPESYMQDWENRFLKNQDF